MAVPYARVRAVFGGTILTAQSWSTAINMTWGAPPPVVNQNVLNTWVQNRVVNVRDFWTVAGGGNTVASIASTGVSLSYLKAYFYPAGSDVATVLAESNFGAALPGTGTVGSPPQTCMVMSTRSLTPGRRGRGRMYLPALAQNVATNGRFITAACDVLANRGAQLINDFSASQIGGQDVSAVVASTAGDFPIVRVEVDNDIDTQRRHSDKLLFTYKATGTITP